MIINCRWAYVKEDNPLDNLEWHDFPEPLESKAEARRYVRAFMSAVQPVIPQMEEGDEHTLRACSLLLIPPPPPGELARRESIPLSLADMAGPDWIKMVRDLASKMSTLPTGFCVSEQQVSSLLKKLERATGIPPCQGCYLPRRGVCICSPPAANFSGWSGGPNTATVEPFPALTGTTATLSTAQWRAPTTSVRATEPRTPPQGGVGIGLRPTTPTASQGSQTGGNHSYAAATLRRQMPAAPAPREAPPSYADTQTADLVQAQEQVMASMANLTAVATPYQPQVFAPPITTAPLRAMGRSSVRLPLQLRLLVESEIKGIALCLWWDVEEGYSVQDPLLPPPLLHHQLAVDQHPVNSPQEAPLTLGGPGPSLVPPKDLDLLDLALDGIEVDPHNEGHTLQRNPLPVEARAGARTHNAFSCTTLAS